VVLIPVGNLAPQYKKMKAASQEIYSLTAMGKMIIFFLAFREGEKLGYEWFGAGKAAWF
jgi:hypothetical protein